MFLSDDDRLLGPGKCIPNPTLFKKKIKTLAVSSLSFPIRNQNTQNFTEPYATRHIWLNVLTTRTDYEGFWASVSAHTMPCFKVSYMPYTRIARTPPHTNESTVLATPMCVWGQPKEKRWRRVEKEGGKIKAKGQLTLYMWGSSQNAYPRCLYSPRCYPPHFPPWEYPAFCRQQFDPWETGDLGAARAPR